MIPNIKQNGGMCHKKECGNVERNRLTIEIFLLTSRTQCCEQMPQEEHCNAVSQSCVSQGKAEGKCLKHPELNQRYTMAICSFKQCCSRKAGGFQERERQGHANRSGISMGQAVEASGQLVTVSILKQEKTLQQEPMSLIMSEAPIKTGTLQKPQYNEEKKTCNKTNMSGNT